ncbi:MAG: hypothetical protein LBH64_01135 [Coriobacteriales bacterium]|jgi:hypothetical protein|nr:hypothetical protein [Coriobacteriales bacterium]
MNRQDTRQDPTQADELAALESVPFDATALTQKTFSKLGLDSQAPVRARRGRGFMAALIAAAAVLVLVPSAFAISGIIAEMGEGPIGFFKSAGATPDATARPNYYAAMQADIEKANAPVGQTLSFEGGSISLDTLAVDDSFINSFFTIRYDEPINRQLMREAFHNADWATLQTLAPLPVGSVDGQEVTAQSNWSWGGDFIADPYFIDERSVGVMVHQALVTDLPDLFDLNIDLPYGIYYPNAANPDAGAGISHSYLNEGFSVTVDKSATAHSRFIEPGNYSFTTTDGIGTLRIDKLTVGPLGAVATVLAQGIGTGNYDFPFLVTDDANNTANFQMRGERVDAAGSFLGEDNVIGAHTVELVGLSPQAQSLTFTPILAKEVERFHTFERVSFDPSQTGARIATSAVGGIELVSHEIQDTRVITKVRPYGYVGPSTAELFIVNNQAATSKAEVGVWSSYFDRSDGLIVTTLDFADAPTLRSAELLYEVIYQDQLSLDSAAAISLPLLER